MAVLYRLLASNDYVLPNLDQNLCPIVGEWRQKVPVQWDCGRGRARNGSHGYRRQCHRRVLNRRFYHIILLYKRFYAALLHTLLLDSLSSIGHDFP